LKVYLQLTSVCWLISARQSRSMHSSDSSPYLHCEKQRISFKMLLTARKQKYMSRKLRQVTELKCSTALEFLKYTSQLYNHNLLPSVLWRCWLGGRKGIRSVKTEWWGTGVVVCLERVADLHMAQLMPLPLTVSCFSKIQIGTLNGCVLRPNETKPLGIQASIIRCLLQARINWQGCGRGGIWRKNGGMSVHYLLSFPAP